MKNKFFFGKFLVAIVAICLLPLNSCTNLDETLYDKVPESNYFRDEAEVKSGVSQVYATLFGLNNHGGYFSTQEVNSNEVLYPQRGGDWEDGRQWLKTYQHVQDGSEDCFRGSWNWLFTGVANANWAIYNIGAASDKGNIDAAKGAGFVAEMRGLRALYYYWLLDTYGNVPIVDNYIQPAGFLPTSNTRAEVYAFVEKELTEISGSLSRDVGGANYARFNYYCAQFLLSKLYLNAQVYKGAAEWDKASAAANEIISSGKYSLNATYRDNFVTNNSGSKENILAVPYDKVFAQGFNLPQMTLHYESQKTFNLEAQPWNGVCTAQDFYNSVDAADARKVNFIAGPQFASDGVTGLVDPQVEAADPDGPGLNFTPEVNALFPNCLRQAGARIGKYEIALGSTPNLSNDAQVFRYADALLVKAEADARKAGDWSNAGTVALVNQVRTRSGMPAFTTLDADAFLKERSAELFYEGWRRSDLIRFGKFGEPTILRPTASGANKQLWPIPKTQINSNPNLGQNDGY